MLQLITTTNYLKLDDMHWAIIQHMPRSLVSITQWVTQEDFHNITDLLEIIVIWLSDDIANNYKRP